MLLYIQTCLTLTQLTFDLVNYHFKLSLKYYPYLKFPHFLLTHHNMIMRSLLLDFARRQELVLAHTYSPWCLAEVSASQHQGRHQCPGIQQDADPARRDLDPHRWLIDKLGRVLTLWPGSTCEN